MKFNSLWPPISIITIMGFFIFGWIFFIAALGVFIYVVTNPQRKHSVLNAIHRNSWPDLRDAMKPNTIQANGVFPNQPTGTSPFNNFSLPRITMSKKTITKIVSITVVIIAVWLILMDGFVNIPAGHVGVVFDRGRGVLENEFDEGLHLKIPFWQSVVLMDTRMQTYTMSTNLSEADLINNTKAMQKQNLIGRSESVILDFAISTSDSNNSIDALTKDGQRVTVDLTVQFQIDGNSASIIYQTIGLNYVDKVVRPAARSITREKVTGFTTKELYNEATRQKLEQEIEATMMENYGEKNVVLGDILIRHIGFSQAYLNAIEEKQIAQQKIEKAEFEKQEAEIRKERTIIEASAEAEAIRLKGEALSANPEIIQLNFVEKMASEIKWGILPDGALPLLDLKSLTK